MMAGGLTHLHVVLKSVGTSARRAGDVRCHGGYVGVIGCKGEGRYGPEGIPDDTRAGHPRHDNVGDGGDANSPQRPFGNGMAGIL